MLLHQKKCAIGCRGGRYNSSSHNNDSVVKNRYSAKAWDNRYGCVLAIEILELLKDVQLDVDLYVGANVQEEVGLRGAKAAAKQIDPDIAFVVDCSPANDIKGKQQLSGVLGRDFNSYQRWYYDT